jgi:hypothetical protein
MSSLAFSMKPRTTSSGVGGGYSGSSGGQTPIRRTRSSPTKGAYASSYDTRMSLTSSIYPTSSTRKSRKNYTQTLVEQRKKSKLKQQRQRQLKKQKQRLVRSSSDTSRKYKRGVLRSSTPIALKRNKRSFFGKSNNNSTNNNNDSGNDAAAAADDRFDIGTTRTNQETTRDDDNEDDNNNNNDPPKEVTIKPVQDEPEKDLIDTVGDAVVNANDAIVAMVCDNKMITKTIFPYMDGEYYDPNAVVSGEKREGGEEMEKVNDFYGGYAAGGPTNCTLEEEEGFEATPTAFYGVGGANNDEVESDSGAAAAATGGGGSVSFGKLGGMVLGTSWAWRAPRQKKDKKSGKSTLDVVPEEAPEDESSSVGKESGSEGKEAKVLLSMYDPPSDESDNNKHNSSNKKVQEEGTIVDGQDLELEMMNDRNVLALGVGAFAVCGGDENTIMTSDQREMTLQDAVVLEDDSDDVMETRKDKLLQQKRGLLARMRARNLRAAKKSLKEESAEVESKNDASEQKGVEEDPEAKSKNDTLSSEQQEVANAKAVLAAFNTDALILKSFELDDGISMQSSISMASDLKSKSSSPPKDTEDKSTGTEESKTPETDDSYPMLWWKWLNSYIDGDV